MSRTAAPATRVPLLRDRWNTSRISGHLAYRLRLIYSNPRIVVATLLSSYLILGFYLLGFNRSPSQVGAIALGACALDLVFALLIYGRVFFPFGALISSLSLSLLLNFSHSYTLLMIPVFFTVASKYLLTLNGKHFFNPSLIGVVLSIILTQDLVTAAPAYQWNGLANMALFIAGPAILLFLPGIKRIPLVLSFLTFFTIQCALRALIMRHHLPFETLFLGTITSPAFILFSFFMITDPPTSPSKTSTQIWVGAAIAFADLLFHLVQSYHTFFYGAVTVASIRFLWMHAGRIRENPRHLIPSTLTLRKYAVVGSFGAGLFFALGGSAAQHHKVQPDFSFEEVETSIQPEFGDIYDRVDPDLQHIIKWLFSVGDAVSVGDFDQDGLEDLFLTFVLKEDQHRASLYRNLGDFRFEKIEIPALEGRFNDPEQNGLPTKGVWVDIDSDGDLDLFITVAFGSPVLLKNLLRESGHPDFVDVSQEWGLAELYINSISATFSDLNRDGLLDLIIGNVLPSHLPDYEPRRRLNFFDLPEPEYEGDNRPYNFMHASWHMANNGGVNDILIQTRPGYFVKQDPKKWNFEATRWTLAMGAADFNQDGWDDLYVANDFGPDDLYLNVEGKTFVNHKGSQFGDIGLDTYKGMNTSIADVDRNGYLDVYVSNVHQALQAEGSLLWLFSKGRDPFYPSIKDGATRLGALNEHRFGWGGATHDLDLDGWVDIVQLNGMVDDSIDKKWEECPDYWYVNEKIARSAPSVHRYINAWGDIRGMCIFGKQSNRVYLNQGDGAVPRFIDVASQVGVNKKGNSRGVAVADLDNDGRPDMVMTHMFAPPTFYRNKARPRDEGGRGDENSWISIELESAEGSGCNRSGIGSQVEVRYVDSQGQPVTQVAQKMAVSGFSAQGTQRIVFGLGNQTEDWTTVDISVRWCGMESQTYDNLSTNKVHRLRQADR